MMFSTLYIPLSSVPTDVPKLLRRSPEFQKWTLKNQQSWRYEIMRTLSWMLKRCAVQLCMLPQNPFNVLM